MTEKKKETKAVVLNNQNNVAIVENLISKAITEKLPVETMEKFLAMRREVLAEQAKKAFDFAMAKFQGECPVIEKTKKVMDKTGGVRYSYASLDSIVGQVKTYLSTNQLSYSIKVENTEKTLIVKCIITHIDGHSEESSFEVPIGTEAYMSDVQKYGARLTFAKRYAFCNALGIMTGDGDTDAVEEPKKLESKPVESKAPVRGNITDIQKGKIQGLVLELGRDMGYLEETIKKSVNSLSIKGAEKIIQTLVNKLAEKQSPKKGVK